MQAGKKLLSRAEVEQIYGITKRYLELAPGRGVGPRFVRIGRLVRYRPGDIEDWIEAQVSGERGQR